MLKIIPVLLILLGIGGGVGAGLYLRPVPEITEIVAEDATPLPRTGTPPGVELGVFEFPNQFMVPLIVEDRIATVVVLSLALEIDDAQRALVTVNLPRLRDAMLQIMFDHANLGGFQGVFTANSTLGTLRSALLEAGQKTLGRDVVFGVLVTDILRGGT